MNFSRLLRTRPAVRVRRMAGLATGLPVRPVSGLAAGLSARPVSGLAAGLPTRQVSGLPARPVWGLAAGRAWKQGRWLGIRSCRGSWETSGTAGRRATVVRGTGTGTRADTRTAGTEAGTDKTSCNCSTAISGPSAFRAGRLPAINTET